MFYRLRLKHQKKLAPSTYKYPHWVELILHSYQLISPLLTHNMFSSTPSGSSSSILVGKIQPIGGWTTESYRYGLSDQPVDVVVLQ
jgi:hypothetical protein